MSKKTNEKPCSCTQTAEEQASSEYDQAFEVTVGSVQREQWLTDSGASSHMTPTRELLTDYCQFEHPQLVGLGDGRPVEAAADSEKKSLMENETWDLVELPDGEKPTDVNGSSK